MNYTKKIWNYQKMLLSSVQSGSIDTTNAYPNSSATGCLIPILIMIIFGFLSSILGGMNTATLLIGSTAYAYLVATSKRKFFAIAPVSRKFAISNLYLLPIVISVIAQLVLMALSFVAILILWACVLIFKIPQDIGADQAQALIYSGGYKTALFCIMFVIIVLFVTITISVIRNNIKRIISLTTFIAVVTGLLVWLKIALPTMPPNTTNILIDMGFSNALPGFEYMHHSATILICMAVFLLIAVPISIMFVNREYMREIVKKPKLF